VNSTPGNIPNEITVDVSGLGIGDSIRVGDLQLPTGVTTDVDPEEAVAIAQVTRATLEAEELEAEAGGAAEEGVAAEGEAGETAEAAGGEAEEAAE
jgi:large subunit ribosomal protein L25